MSILVAAVLHEAAAHCCSLEVVEMAGVGGVSDELLESFAENCPKLREVNVKVSLIV